MKRKIILLMALCVLLLTGAARAANVVDRDSVFVSALYSAGGKFLNSVWNDVSAGNTSPTKAAEFTNKPDGASVKTFLLDAGTLAPYAPETQQDGDVYAILYDDGKLVFQYGDTPDSSQGNVTNTYAVDMESVYTWDWNNYRPTTPWYSKHEQIQCVDFADKIQPKSIAYWFRECENLAEIANISNLDTSHVIDMSEVFSGCDKLTALDLSDFDTFHVTNMRSMFYGCDRLTALDLSGFDTSHVTDMSEMFYGCDRLTALDLSGFDTSRVTDMSEMFYGCDKLTALDLSDFDTFHVTNMRIMFYNCSGLTTLDLSSFDTFHVTDMGGMFSGCDRLTTLDLSGFDISHVTDMNGMFYGCDRLTTLDLSGFDTSNVTDMGSMFSGCSGLTTLDLSGFDTSNVTSMDYMFSDCIGLTELDLSGFDTSKVTSSYYGSGVNRMFSGCVVLTTIYASEKFITDQVENSDDMFYRCESLTGGAGTVYDENHTNAEYARIDAPGTPGYFTMKK